MSSEGTGDFHCTLTQKCLLWEWFIQIGGFVVHHSNLSDRLRSLPCVATVHLYVLQFQGFQVARRPWEGPCLDGDPRVWLCWGVSVQIATRTLQQGFCTTVLPAKEHENRSVQLGCAKRRHTYTHTHTHTHTLTGVLRSGASTEGIHWHIFANWLAAIGLHCTHRETNLN